MPVTFGTYPVVGQISKESETTFIDDLVVDTSISNKTRVRSLADAVYKALTVKYAVLTNQQKLDIEEFYTINRAYQFNFIWNYYGETAGAPTYSVVFAESPKFQALGGLYWTGEVKLKQVQ